MATEPAIAFVTETPIAPARAAVTLLDVPIEKLWIPVTVLLSPPAMNANWLFTSTVLNAPPTITALELLAEMAWEEEYCVSSDYWPEYA